jgi:hypothetical protein
MPVPEIIPFRQGNTPSVMSTLSQGIDALLNEANDCELIGNLATLPEVREANRVRAAELRGLASEARRLDQATDMRALKKVEYHTADELDELATQREAEASQLPPGALKQSVLKEIARLRSYASMKRLLSAD